MLTSQHMEALWSMHLEVIFFEIVERKAEIARAFKKGGRGGGGKNKIPIKVQFKWKESMN